MERVCIYFDEDNVRHDPGPSGPDRPMRIRACVDELLRSSVEFEFRRPSPATRADLERVHPSSHLDRLQEIARHGGGRVDLDTVLGPHSMEVAHAAAGACIEAAWSAAHVGVRSFCLIRPPGHHATADRSMGFCLINNLAVACAALLHRGIERIVVVDFDVHHGNGTQEIFWEDPRVLYISIHQWPWYPWRSGALEEIGGGDGRGATVNVPLPAYSGDGLYLAVVDAVVTPIISEFAPEVVLVSAGFDAAASDPLSLMEVSTEGFGAMATAIVAVADQVCDGKIMLALEGGYDPDALGAGVRVTAEVLAGRTFRAPERKQDDQWMPTLGRIVAFHRARWKIS